ncbi:F-box/kelch-repeat protein At3g23880-like [Lotus japonicus]|uniref:F-box/kelch-repeat protein At3g23880-like n=1 Tax=Lotus japonicus TaxID=34305 RepID=UPI0025890217|nr:F-box/kelch-repeat protein At3g23880-like [Lotus japonicus]
MSRRLSPPVIPDELIYEILLKLPVESLWRLRRVCKTWKTLISHPQFAKDHFHTSISVNDKYKVLAFGVGSGFSKFVPTLYTFGERESNWRTMIQDLPFTSCIRGLRQTFVNGNLHWLIKSGHDSDKLVIISFDVEKETHGEVLLPPELEGGFWSLHLFVSNKHLYVGHRSYNTCFVLWLMKDYGVQESWTKVMTIPLNSEYCICRCNATHHLRPLCIFENGVVVLRTTCSNSYLATYDSNNGKFKRHYCGNTRNQSKWCGGIYHESLVSPP